MLPIHLKNDYIKPLFSLLTCCSQGRLVDVAGAPGPLLLQTTNETVAGALEGDEALAPSQLIAVE